MGPLTGPWAPVSVLGLRLIAPDYIWIPGFAFHSLPHSLCLEPTSLSWLLGSCRQPRVWTLTTENKAKLSRKPCQGYRICWNNPFYIPRIGDLYLLSFDLCQSCWVYSFYWFFSKKQIFVLLTFFYWFCFSLHWFCFCLCYFLMAACFGFILFFFSVELDTWIIGWRTFFQCKHLWLYISLLALF